MKRRDLFPIILVLIILGGLVAWFPPGRFSWARFFTDSTPVGTKLVFLLKVYAVPAALSFSAVVLFQLQMRLSLGGAPVSVIFPLCVLGATSMLAAFRTMVGGIGGVPGYAVGMATAYTLMSRLYRVRPSERTLFGQPLLKIVWRGDPEATREIQMMRAGGRQQLQPAAPR